MRKISDYVLAVKAALGDRHMSDRELGEQLGGYSAGLISNARYGICGDPLAVKLAGVLKIDAGEVLLVARAEREKDATIRGHLLAYAKKALASVPSRVVGALVALAVALGMSLQPREALASGGAGRPR